MVWRVIQRGDIGGPECEYVWTDEVANVVERCGGPDRKDGEESLIEMYMKRVLVVTW